MKKENKQKTHYESIHDIYEKTYYDECSMEYRKRFIYRYFFDNIDLNNKSIADIASGSGYNSLVYLKYFPKAYIEGYDIDKHACKTYTKNVGNNCYECDLTEPINVSRQYDAVIVVGGLHHLVQNLDNAFENISKMVKKDGLLIMYEPNKEYVLERLRKVWYKKDKYFEHETEEALSHNEILGMTKGKFKLYDLKYLGGPAYFLILNSMIFRIPLKIKKIIAPLLFLLEALFNRVSFRTISPTFIARWKRTEK